VPSLSTHVLDSAAGGPRPGVTVTVVDTGGTTVASAVTDAEGRITDLAGDLPPGRYHLRWDTGGRFLQEVAVGVLLSEERHYHIPLLASPVSAVTYLGQ
jgi:5-hydroxyisourate hydrolase